MDGVLWRGETGNAVRHSLFLNYLSITTPDVFFSNWFDQVTEVADEIGVGVHFNPYVTWNKKVLEQNKIIV